MARGLRVSGAHYYLKGRVLGRPTWSGKEARVGDGGSWCGSSGIWKLGAHYYVSGVLGREASGEEGGLGEVEGIIAY